MKTKFIKRIAAAGMAVACMVATTNKCVCVGRQVKLE